ncbi:MAG: DUF1810 family protein [Phenylobacterium sp.]|uniref:DUF1810 domain-containing protein n=1 Tax=Phenylobacterium sp. TaxID=1871053 RepID=UPI0025D6E9F5|nr:DUF1810 domain-containing protein [Phenylobacterium sp.]MBI1197727.1 DUF1810 family protein [Phenylobacterium sp.]
MADPFDLQRFVDAQDAGGTYARALAELRAGRKQSHWMWFVFPQIEGLGFSAMSRRYAISGLAEAAAYLAHPVLGPRLRECVAAVNAVKGRSARELMGSPDDMKLRSCLTLFARAAPDAEAFKDALSRYFAGEEDPATVSRVCARG